MRHYKIQLVFPPIDPVGAVSLAPIGLLKIAAVLDKAGYDVSVLDCILLLRKGLLSRDSQIYEHIADLICRSQPDLVGLNTQCASYPSCLNIARRIKSLRPKTTTVLGGPFAHLCPEATLIKFPEIDFIVTGEGEITLLKLIQALENHDDPRAVDGLVFREQDQIIRTKTRRPVENLDDMPHPAYHLLDRGQNAGNPLQEYQITNSAIVGWEFPRKALIDDGRGCAHRCSYCTEPLVWGRQSRRRSPANILDEISWLKAEFGVQLIEFTHDHFTSRRSDVEKFCQALLEQGVDIQWICRARLDKVDPKLLEQMKASGCSEIIYGVESFSADLLKSMKKDMRAIERVRSAIEHTVSLKILAHLSFIIGFPWEHAGQVERTLDEILEITERSNGWAVPYIQLLSVQPGTELWTKYHEKLVLRRIPGFCEGIDFNNRSFLDEDLKLIQNDSLIFSPFYNIIPEHIPLDTLSVVSTCFKPILMSQPKAFKVLLEMNQSPLLEFFQGMTQWLSHEIDDLNKLRSLPREELHDLINRYGQSFGALQFLKSLTSKASRSTSSSDDRPPQDRE